MGNTSSPLALETRNSRRKRRVLILFIVLGVLTLVMGVGLFAFYPNLTFPRGALAIGIRPPARGGRVAGHGSSAGSQSGIRSGKATVQVSHPARAGSGVVSLPVGFHASAFQLHVANLVPGDGVAQLVTVTNGTGSNLTGYELAVSSTPATPLTEDRVNGLQLVVERCSVPWAGSAPVATCAGRLEVAGRLSPLEGSRRLATAAFCSPSAPAPASGCAVRGDDHLRLLIVFPATASNRFQGLSTEVTFTFSASPA